MKGNAAFFLVFFVKAVKNGFKNKVTIFLSQVTSRQPRINLNYMGIKWLKNFVREMSPPIDLANVNREDISRIIVDSWPW